MLTSKHRQDVYPILSILSSGSVFDRVLHWRLLAVTLVEAIHASRRVNQFLFTGEKWMASGADFHVQVALFGRPSLKSFAAGAGDCNLVVCWMNLWFHYSLEPHYRQLNAVFSKQTMIGFDDLHRQAAAHVCHEAGWLNTLIFLEHVCVVAAVASECGALLRFVFALGAALLLDWV